MSTHTHFPQWINPGGLVAETGGFDRSIHNPGTAQGAGVAESAEAIKQRNEAIKAASARKLIQERWLAIGGPASDLGLPYDPNFPPMKTADAHEVVFRGGSMRVLDDHPDDITIDVRYRARVTFQGIGLEMRQESDGDELFGTISVAMGSTVDLKHYTIPEFVLGPDANNRIYQGVIELHNGRPNDISVIAKIFEHDSGDRAALRQEARNRVKQAFESGTAIVGAAAGGAVGTAATAIGNESKTQGSFFDWLRDGLADGITNFLGIGDDEYNTVAVDIPFNDMIRIPPTLVYHCSHDSRSIEYTHKMTTTCRDDGGDMGQISLLFKVTAI
jgi:hypothetical protein